MKNFSVLCSLLGRPGLACLISNLEISYELTNHGKGGNMKDSKRANAYRQIGKKRDSKRARQGYLVSVSSWTFIPKIKGGYKTL